MDFANQHIDQQGLQDSGHSPPDDEDEEDSEMVPVGVHQLGHDAQPQIHQVWLSFVILQCVHILAFQNREEKNIMWLILY